MVGVADGSTGLSVRCSSLRLLSATVLFDSIPLGKTSTKWGF